MVAMTLQARDTCLLRNSRLMGIPEFRSMVNDVEIFRRSKVCSFGAPMKTQGTEAFQERFYWILGDLLWRVCENHDDISQSDFYKLYRWFHLTRKLLKPPPPMPDYVSPFAKKHGRKEPVATIRMTTRTNPVLDSLYVDHDAMRSKVDPARYLALLGSNVSLTESITSTLRLGTGSKPSDALLQALAETEAESARDSVWGTRQRILGTLRNVERSATAPSGARRSLSHPPATALRPNSSGLLPNLIRSSSSIKGKYSYEINGEIDADATLVDVDGILDQGSELMLKDLVALSPACMSPGRVTPPLPSVDVLSKRQLKLIGTTTPVATLPPTSPSSTPGDKTLSHIINSVEKKASTSTAELTPSVLVEMAGFVGEKMMVNRARLLLLQHQTEITDKAPHNMMPSKPPTAPPGIARPSPLPSMHTIDSRTSMTERATTAPITRAPVVRRASSKLRGTTASWSVPCRSESRARESMLSEPFTVQAVNPTTTKSPYPVPPPSASSLSSVSFNKQLSSSDRARGSEQLSSDGVRLLRTPHKERCAHYKDPHQENGNYTPLQANRGYTPLEDDENRTLSETPLLQIGQDNFSSLSSFLPSSHSLVLS